MSEDTKIERPTTVFQETLGRRRLTSISAAAVLFYVWGLGWLAGFLPVLLFTAFTGRYFDQILGAQTPLRGPFYDYFGTGRVLAFGVVFILVTLAGILAGYWLWKSQGRGGILGFGVIATWLFFSYGYGLPAGPIFASAEAILLAIGWKGLR